MVGKKLSTEQKILKAAREEFISTGLAGARMQAIADSAGVNKALLHYYFRSKENLYEAALRDVIESVWCELDKQVKKAGDIKNLRDFLRIFISTYIYTLGVDKNLPRMIMREIIDGGKMMPVLFKGIFTRFVDIRRQGFLLIEKEINAGNIRKVDPSYVFMNIIGMCIITFFAQPIITTLAKEFGSEITYNRDYFDTRIESILTTVCDGLFLKGN